MVAWAPSEARLLTFRPERFGQAVAIVDDRTENPATNAFCSLCGMPLDQQQADLVVHQDTVRQRADDLLDSMLGDPHFRESFLKKLRDVAGRDKVKPPSAA